MSFLLWKSNSIIWLILLIINSIVLLFVSWKILVIIIPAIILFLLSFNAIENSYTSISRIEGNFKVEQKLNSGIIIEKNNSKVFVKTYEIFSIDDLIQLKSNDVKKVDIKNSDFERYLKSLNVDWICNKPKIKLIRNGSSFKRNVNDYLIRGPSYYSRYVPLILFGIRYPKNQVVVNKMKEISIIHLFTISGFHINIILFIILKILNIFKIKNKYVFLISSIIVFPYIFLMSFPIAATRAYIFSILLTINKYFLNNKFSKLNLLSCVAIGFFILNPYVIYSLSFVFTFLFTYIVLITNHLRGKYKKILSTIFLMLTSTLINIFLNNEINLTLVFSSLILSPIIGVSYVITIFFFWCKPLMDNYFLIIDLLINVFIDLKISISFSLDTNVIIILITLLIIILILLINKDYNSSPCVNKLIVKLFNNYKN